jgi:hypothetical protein
MARSFHYVGQGQLTCGPYPPSGDPHADRAAEFVAAANSHHGVRADRRVGTSPRI